MMKTSKNKSKIGKKPFGKKGLRHVVDNVPVHTSLPPKVEGQIRCHLRLSVLEIVWFVGSPPDVSCVRVRWWGEDQEAVFVPADKRKHKTLGGTGTVARYAIRSGPKQFAAYLSDMKSLTFELLSGPNRIPVGKCVLKDLPSLSPSTPVSGVYTVLSSNDEKIAELKISLRLESLMSSYDSNQSLEAPSDVHHSAEESLRPVKLVAVPSSKPRVRDDSHDPFISPVAQPPAKDSRAGGLQGVDHSYYSQASTVYERPTRDVGLNAPTKSALYQLDLASGPSSDLISALLDRGTKLKKAMIVSAMQEPSLKASLSNPDVSSICQQDLPLDTSIRRTSSTGDLFRALLGERPRRTTLNETDFNSKAVDLVLGSAVTSRELAGFRAVLEGRSLSTTLSDDPSTLTENADPAKDESILEELFYSKTALETEIASDDDFNKTGDDVTLKSSAKKRRHSSLESPGNRRSSSRDVTPRRSRENTPTRSRDSRRSSVEDDQTSQTSRVSFDLPTSDDEDARRKSAQDGLSVERLTLLGRISKARVVIETLILTDEALKKDGKPPRPDQKKISGTYFVEYQFPVSATSRDQNVNCKAAEMMRIASKKIADGAITFNHRSMFPITFDGDSLEEWWKSVLVFKVYGRTISQKVPGVLGTCSLPLKSVLQSDSLYVDKSLQVRASNVDKLSLGKLRISVELASDSKDFANALAKTRLAEMKNPNNIVPIDRRTPKKSTVAEKRPSPAKPAPVAPIRAPVSSRPLAQTNPDDQGEAVTLHTLLVIREGRNITVNGTRPIVQPPADGRPQHPLQPTATSATATNLCKRDTHLRNTYLVCRMFWQSDNVRTNVCWGTTDPKYNFSQVTPILITTSLLERMRNNVMVIEVWDKKASSENDKLVGLVKLPLHQFYLSYREPRIMRSLLKSQYPVTSVDQFLPVVDPFSARQYGQIHVLLAMGSLQQITCVQRSLQDTSVVPQNPLIFRERQDLVAGTKPSSAGENDLVQHLFEVVVEGIRELDLGKGMIWGEADIFVQYHFPSQQTAAAQQHHDAFKNTQQPLSLVAQILDNFSCSDHNVLLNGHLYNTSSPSIVSPTLKPVRSVSTLCVPEPVFHDVMTHRILLPQGTPVQREILAACAGVGGGAGGIPFELWCRHYTPNVRDRVIAKANLPLARLCALITMHKPGQPSVQTFSLSLQPCMLENIEDESKPKMGLLDVTLTYKPSSFVSRSDLAVSRNLASSQVCLSVGVIRASGLKAAAESVARLNSAIQYPSEVGINAYCRVKLSFLSKEDERLTKTVARSFTPEFSHYLDFPCPLLWCEAGSEALCLAEILESADLCLEIWHQTPGGQNDPDLVTAGREDVVGRKLIATFSDTLMGSVTIPLKPLLYKKTGIKGWYPVQLPSLGWSRDGEATPTYKHHLLERVVGGLELAIKFAHHDDRERVLYAGKSVGWVQETQVEEEWQSLDDSRTSFHQVVVHVDTLCFPLANALSAGKTILDKNTACYVRYKFYDKAAVCSKLQMLSPDEPVARVTFNHRKVAHVQASSPFHWYLREERLEIQVWITTSTDGSQRRPRHRDKLIGSAYVDMTPLVSPSSRQRRVSDIFALFKPGTPSLRGACLLCHMSLEADSRQGSAVRYRSLDSSLAAADVTGTASSSDECMLSEDEIRTFGKSRRSPTKSLPNEGETFPCLISVERALHLNEIADTKTGKCTLPCAYVSYQSAESHTLTYTEIMNECVAPVWNHQHQTRLHKSLLQADEKTLVLKVWHRTLAGATDPDISCDRVVGFVTVDLAPLTCGLQQLCGWYNIIDFLGQCQGQIKISVIPQERLDVGGGGVKDKPAVTTSAASYTFSTAGSYPAFPSHISRFTEQSVTLAPSERSGQTQNQISVSDDDREPASRSMLFRTLRSNLDELDQINTRLSTRLNRPTVNVSAAPTSAPTSVSETERLETRRKMQLSTVEESSLSSVTSLTPPTKDETLAQATIEDALSRARRLLELGGFSSADELQRPATRDGSRNDNRNASQISSDVLETVRRLDEPDASANVTSSTKLIPSDNECENESVNESNASDQDDSFARHFLADEREEYYESDEEDVVQPRPLNNISCLSFSNSVDQSWREHYGEPRDFHELSRGLMKTGSKLPDSPVKALPRKEEDAGRCSRQLQYESAEKVARPGTANIGKPSSKPELEETLNGSRGMSGVEFFPESPRDHYSNQGGSENEREDGVPTPKSFEFLSESSEQLKGDDSVSDLGEAKHSSVIEESESELESESDSDEESDCGTGSESETSDDQEEIRYGESAIAVPDEVPTVAQDLPEPCSDTPTEDLSEAGVLHQKNVEFYDHPDTVEIEEHMIERTDSIAELELNDDLSAPVVKTGDSSDSREVNDERRPTLDSEPSNESISSSHETQTTHFAHGLAPELNTTNKDTAIDLDEESAKENVEPGIQDDSENCPRDRPEMSSEQASPGLREAKLSLADRPPRAARVPDYFLPADDLAKSMRTLRMVTALQAKSQSREAEVTALQQRSVMMRRYMDRIPARAPPARDDVISPVKQGVLARQTKPAPTADEAKRIARIFSSRHPKTDA